MKTKTASSKWRMENGLILFEVTSDGTTAPAWIEKTEKLSKIGVMAKNMLRAKQDPNNSSKPYFKPTKGVKYQVAVMLGSDVADVDRSLGNIRIRADQHKLFTPPIELACLIPHYLEVSGIKEMGLRRIITMHDPFGDSEGNWFITAGSLILLGSDIDHSALETFWGDPQYRCLYRNDGFAFLLNQVS
mgnify:CR=1 FL=1